MKRKFKIILTAAFLQIIPLIMLAQAPPHPNGGSVPETGSGHGPVGSGDVAPVGNGLYILIALVLAYGIIRWYIAYKQKTEEA